MANLTKGTKVKVGTIDGNGSLDISSTVANYKDLRANDFFLDFVSLNVGKTAWSYGSNAITKVTTIGKSYNASTGVLTLNNAITTGAGANTSDCYFKITHKVDVYVYTK